MEFGVEGIEPEGLEDFDALLKAAQGEGGEPDLDALFKGVSGEVPEGAFEGILAAEDFETLLRDSWALPKLDVGRELARADATHRPDRGVHDDPFSSEDYTDEQWALVLVLKQPCLDAVTAEVSPKKRAAAISWIFDAGVKDKHGLSFDQTCRALGSRSFVVRALIQHFWYLRGIILTEGLPYMSHPLSEVLENEAIMVGGELGMRIAQVAWRFPSIEEPELFRRLGAEPGTPTHEDHARALGWLVEGGILAQRFGRIYFTSRHPERRHKPNALQGKVRGVSWSQSFFGDEDA